MRAAASGARRGADRPAPRGDHPAPAPHPPGPLLIEASAVAGSHSRPCSAPGRRLREQAVRRKGPGEIRRQLMAAFDLRGGAGADRRRLSDRAASMMSTGISWTGCPSAGIALRAADARQDQFATRQAPVFPGLLSAFGIPLPDCAPFLSTTAISSGSMRSSRVEGECLPTRSWATCPILGRIGDQGALGDGDRCQSPCQPAASQRVERVVPNSIQETSLVLPGRYCPDRIQRDTLEGTLEASFRVRSTGNM
jgi:hypothetical protein